MWNEGGLLRTVRPGLVILTRTAPVERGVNHLCLISDENDFFVNPVSVPRIKQEKLRTCDQGLDFHFRGSHGLVNPHEKNTTIKQFLKFVTIRTQEDDLQARRNSQDNDPLQVQPLEQAKKLRHT